MVSVFVVREGLLTQNMVKNVSFETMRKLLTLICIELYLLNVLVVAGKTALMI